MECYKAYQKWELTEEGVINISIAKINAWVWFIKQFPNTDQSQFVVQVYVDEKHNVSTEMFFKEGPGSQFTQEILK